MRITRRDAGTEDSAIELVVDGSIDVSSSQELVAAGLDALAEQRSLCLDLSAVDFVDSAGIGALVALAKAAPRESGSFALSATSPQVERVLEVTGLADAWTRL